MNEPYNLKMMNERSRVIEKWILLLSSGAFAIGTAVFLKGNAAKLAPCIWMFFWSLFFAVLKTCLEWFRFTLKAYKSEPIDLWLIAIAALSAASLILFFTALATIIHAYTQVWGW